MDKPEIRAILYRVHYPGFHWIVGGEDRLWMRAEFSAACSRTGDPCSHLTRRWYISRDTTKSEVVQTALKCVLTALEHEAREQFTYCGRAIFGPHFDVDALVTLCDQEKLGARKTSD